MDSNNNQPVIHDSPLPQSRKDLETAIVDISIAHFPMVQLRWYESNALHLEPITSSGCKIDNALEYQQMQINCGLKVYRHSCLN